MDWQVLNSLLQSPWIGALCLLIGAAFIMDSFWDNEALVMIGGIFVCTGVGIVLRAIGLNTTGWGVLVFAAAWLIVLCGFGFHRALPSINRYLSRRPILTILAGMFALIGGIAYVGWPKEAFWCLMASFTTLVLIAALGMLVRSKIGKHE